MFAAANRSERDLLLEIAKGLKGVLIGGKSYICPA
jgi:hypothetical protein